MGRHRFGWMVVFSLACVASAVARTPSRQSPAAHREAERLARPSVPERHLDRSGRIQRGRASYYASRFDDLKMADGRRFDPGSNVAASKTLPLGTTAKVTNVQNGRSALVMVEDRGPHIHGRVVDLTPKVADQLEMKKTGVTPVLVAPVAVPQLDGAVKLGAGAASVSDQDIQVAVLLAQAAAGH